jgi:N-formylglutamate amidohydrolase
LDAVLDIKAPARQILPMVFASPHSGQDYPASFLAQSALDPQSLRRSEDSFVDELFASATARGAPLLKALFARAYLDANREAYELDPSMFDGPLPDFVNGASPRVGVGLGTIARVVANGAEIYRDKLTYADAEHRIDHFYRPYHEALVQLLARTRAQFGYYVLVDCHSMPAMTAINRADGGPFRIDFVLGDCFGTSCSGIVTHAAEAVLRQLGYRVVRNSPYAGGFTTRHYGVPAEGRHALQIEVSRHLYMNEVTHVKRADFHRLQFHLDQLVAALGRLPAAELIP